jgi:hypothetical protein
MASSNSRNMNNNLFGDMSNSDILFINILNTMYNDNLRIIHHLMDQNNEITSQLIDVFNNRRRQNNPLNTRSYNHNNNRNRNIPNQTGENSSRNAVSNNGRRVYIDNIPYYVDDLQLFTIPNTNTSTNATTTRTDANISNQFSRILNSFLEPINIVPTQTQIENATRNILYGDILDPINNSCPISLETFIDTSNVTMIRPCRHIFNRNNLMAWFNSNCKCPVCRYDIRNYNPDDNNSNTNTNTNNQQQIRQENEEENESEEIDSENNAETNEQNRLNANTTNLNNNSIETLFVEILTDLSNNNIEYTLDNTSQLFNSLFSVNRRRESRR